ncbi:COG4223 family protein, partial [Phormidesmis sp. 146-33]
AAGPQTASPEMQKQLDAALARLDEAEATATARAAEAAAATAAAQRTRALDALSARIAAGEPFAAELTALDDPAVAQVLASHAETGVPTLVQLQAAFPDAAREALRIARETSGGDGWGSRALDFLAAQTEARPLTPLEGNTPEAILSRADFALSEGRVADAVTELQPLDSAVKAAVQPWLDAAQVHLAAVAALQAARGE